MAAVNLPIIPYTVPADTCYPDSVQELINMVAKSTVLFSSSAFTLLIVGPTAPAVTDRDKLWFNTNDSRTYSWNTGESAWVVRHSYSAGSPVRLWWTDTAASAATFDGGDTNPIGNASGPMWEEDGTWAGRMPIGAGTLLHGTLTIAVGGTGGTENVTLTQANLPNVQLTVSLPLIGTATVGTPEPVVDTTYGSTPVAGSGRVIDSTSQDFAGRYKPNGQTAALGSGTAFSALPPYKAGIWLQRTARIYYKGS